jgi:hypothetical protein
MCYRKTLEAFSDKLREETDLEALSDDQVGWLSRRCSLLISRCGYDPIKPQKVSRRTSNPYSINVWDGIFSEVHMQGLA